jgi:hypothetical protein
MMPIVQERVHSGQLTVFRESAGEMMTSLMSPETKQMIKKAFDLTTIGAGPHYDFLDGKTSSIKFGVNYLWLIEVSLNNTYFTLACVQKESEQLELYHEGILLPIKIHSKTYDPIVDELSAVRLPENLSLEKEMQCVSILPLGQTINLEYTPYFNIVAITHKAIVTYDFAGIHETPSTRDLQSAIFKTFRFLLKEHNHPVLNELAKPDYGF